MVQNLIAAIRTLTVLPVPGREAAGLAGSLPWFPVVGCILGVSLYLIGNALDLLSDIWPEGTAAVVLACSVVLTRGFHLDGLADWADGFWGGSDRVRVLAIMKDSRVGTFGILAVVLVLLLKYVAFLQFVRLGRICWVVPAFVVSRAAIVELAAVLPYARSEGGTAAPFVQNARSSHRFGSLFVSLLLLFCFAGLTGPVLLALGFVVCRILGFWFRRRIGGITGDLLGACSEIIETGLLFLCATANEWLFRLTIGGIFDL